MMGQVQAISADTPIAFASDPSPPASAARYGTSRPGWRDGNRHKSLLLTLLVYVVPAAALLFHWQGSAPTPPPPSVATFNVAPPAAPPEPVREVPSGPKQVETRQTPARPETAQLVLARPIVSAPPPAPADPPSEAVKPAPPVERTTAPDTRPAPPAQQASNEKATWEGLVLAALNKVKRYPREAQFRRQQGVPYIRFVIDRGGQVVSSTLERSSGVRSLDAEAIALPKRAQPLPKPPEDRKGATIELVVPVEFFVGG